MTIQEQQTLIFLLHDLKASFIVITHELNERWEKAQKIKDFFVRVKEYHDIFSVQDEVVSLMRMVRRALKEV